MKPGLVPLCGACMTLACAQICFSAEEVQIYRSPSGTTHYSDRPLYRPPTAVVRPDCAPEYLLQITSPQNNSARISPAGRLRIRYQLRPPLCPGHRLQILRDDQAMEIPTLPGEVLLRNLDPGAHRLQLRILREDGKLLAQSVPHRVHLL